MATYNAWNYGSGALTGNPQIVRSDLTDGQRVDFSRFYFYIEDLEVESPRKIGYLHLCNWDGSTLPNDYSELYVMGYVGLWSPTITELSPIRDVALTGNGLNVAVFYPQLPDLGGKEFGFDFYARRMTGTLW